MKRSIPNQKEDHEPYRPVLLCPLSRGISSFSPSSRMTLSPKTQTSNSRLAISRFRMFLLGLLLALMSSAQTPMTPQGAGLVSSLSARCSARSLLGL
ncbi:hypothetical protein VTK73DRAFT_5217 [Phialemonium thermophilum]|uniref:Uncharacterized protein n=1 Tax=Phialemonium thermophilum TaxID=223376 RepID=A0ABR3V383_9PEZI